MTDSIEELRTRLAAAELVCDLYGITSAGEQTERGDALTQAWQDWHIPYGKSRPRVSNETIRDLAARRREIRERTLRSIRGTA